MVIGNWLFWQNYVANGQKYDVYCRIIKSGMDFFVKGMLIKEMREYHKSFFFFGEGARIPFIYFGLFYEFFITKHTCNTNNHVHVYISRILTRNSEARVSSMRPSQECKRCQTPNSWWHGSIQPKIGRITANQILFYGTPTFYDSTPVSISVGVHDHVCVHDPDHK